MRPCDPACYIFQRQRKYEEVTNLVSHMIRNDVRSRTSGWKPPSIKMVKLNSDGASKDHIMTGCGSVIHDMRGDWIGFFPSIWKIVVLSWLDFGEFWKYSSSLRVLGLGEWRLMLTLSWW